MTLFLNQNQSKESKQLVQGQRSLEKSKLKMQAEINKYIKRRHHFLQPIQVIKKSGEKAVSFQFPFFLLTQSWGWQNVFCKRVRDLLFHLCRPDSFCCNSLLPLFKCKSSHRQYGNTWLWLGANKTLFTKMQWVNQQKVMAPYSSTLACKIPWTKEPCSP